MFLILVSLLSIFSVDGFAMCTFTRAPLSDRVKEADLVVIGRMLTRAEKATNGPKGTIRVAKIEVSRFFKGKASNRLDVYFNLKKSQHDCSQDRFDVLEEKGAIDEDFLFFLKKIDGRFITSFEMGSHIAWSKFAKSDIKQLSKMEFK